MLKRLVVGLIKGRHAMPEEVESYVFNEPVINPTDVDWMFRHAKKFIKSNISVPKETMLIIYVTGLTPALLSVLSAARLEGVNTIACMHWNRETNTYFCQVI